MIGTPRCEIKRSEAFNLKKQPNRRIMGMKVQTQHLESNEMEMPAPCGPARTVHFQPSSLAVTFIESTRSHDPEHGDPSCALARSDMGFFASGRIVFLMPKIF